MALTPLPSQDYLRKILDYNPETGALTWKHREDVPRQWNTRYAGLPAFTKIDKNGYCMGELGGKSYSSHRIIWKYVYGFDPEQIDHINGRPADNRIENLRSVTIEENNRNMRRRHDNKSGVSGVHWERRKSKWCARIKVAKKWKFLGYFSCLNEAAAVRKRAERERGYHPNHGR